MIKKRNSKADIAILSRMQKTFTEIYATKKWWNGSGRGSEPESVKTYCDFLGAYIRINNIKTVLDLGCGDWKFSRYMNWDNLEYIGVDIVQSLVDTNNKLYASSNISFICMDGFRRGLPSADLIIVKDVLQHWPNKTIKEFGAIARSYPYSLITNTIAEYSIAETGVERETTGKVNRDIMLGDVRSLNLALPPFNWKVEEVFRYDYIVDARNRHDMKSVVAFQNQ